VDTEKTINPRALELEQQIKTLRAMGNDLLNAAIHQMEVELQEILFAKVINSQPQLPCKHDIRLSKNEITLLKEENTTNQNVVFKSLLEKVVVIRHGKHSRDFEIQLEFKDNSTLQYD